MKRHARFMMALALAALGCSEETTGGTTGGGTGGGDLGLQFGAADDPKTCDEAASQRSYLGCDYWPTVTFNSVWAVFDFAVVIANIGSEPADVAVDGRDGTVFSTTVQPLSVAKITLPWVPELKGTETDVCGNSMSPSASVLVQRGAYHLTSTRPVAVYQFNALEYRGAGGPEGKSWEACPGHDVCAEFNGPVGCYSFSNDASILLPSTALTGAYRVSSIGNVGSDTFIAITGVQDATNVRVQLATGSALLAGGPTTGAQADFTFVLNAGDVAQLASDMGADLAGTLVTADKPVQAIAGAACAAIATDADGTCDHLEESLLPAETLGKRYLVTAPTGPLGQPTPYALRLIGNANGTTLSYPSGMPPGAPATLDAGMVVDLGIVTGDFEIVGSHELAVATFLPSASVIAAPDALSAHGDPSQSQVVAVEQYRKSYVFLAPDDYDVSFIDVIAPTGTEVKLDELAMPGTPTPLGASGFEVTRVRLGLGQAGAHVISSDVAIGVQVIGYGSYTSYQYPAGMHLQQIAPPPEIN